MYFTQTPPQHAPLGQELRYAIAGHDGSNLDIHISDPESGQLIGAKRFIGVTEAVFDIAPYLRPSIRFTPTEGSTGFCAAQGRTVAAKIKVSTQSRPPISTTGTFLAVTSPAEAPALLTTMPRERIIGAEECDELTYFTAEPCIVTVTAYTSDSLIAESFREEGTGLHIFHLNLRDFPMAETLTVDAGVCGTVTYTVERLPQRGRRLAWRTDAGSVEHYTFPVEKSERVEVSKKWAYGSEGYLATEAIREVRTVLISAFEQRTTLTALSGLLCSPQVWLVEASNYTLINVVSSSAIPHCHDVVGTLEVEIRPTRKSCSPWS